MGTRHGKEDVTFLTGRKHDRIRPHSGDTAQSPRAFHAATRRGGSHVRKSAPERRATKREALAQDSPRTTLPSEKPSEKPSEHILAPDALLGRASNVSDVAVRVTRPCACGRIQLIMWTCRAGCPCGGVCYHLRTTCRVRLYIIVLRLCRGCESLIWKNKNDAASRPCSWCGACRLWLGWL